MSSIQIKSGLSDLIFIKFQLFRHPSGGKKTTNLKILHFKYFQRLIFC